MTWVKSLTKHIFVRYSKIDRLPARMYFSFVLRFKKRATNQIQAIVLSKDIYVTLKHFNYMLQTEL